MTMQRHAERNRTWDQWPGRSAPEDRLLGRLRSLFAPTDHEDAFAELIASRGHELEERSAQIRGAVVDLERRQEQARELHARVEQILREGAAELDVRQAELDVRAADLDRREAAVVRAEARVAERRRELGAVELRRAALERREDVVRGRELELERKAVELAALARQLDELGGVIEATRLRRVVEREDEHVAITSNGQYRILPRPGPAPAPGETVELEDGKHVCARVMRSPYPADTRRCVLLERLDPAPPE
jgi:hypothetical protein